MALKHPCNLAVVWDEMFRAWTCGVALVVVVEVEHLLMEVNNEVGACPWILLVVTLRVEVLEFLCNLRYHREALACNLDLVVVWKVEGVAVESWDYKRVARGKFRCEVVSLDFENSPFHRGSFDSWVSICGMLGNF